MCLDLNERSRYFVKIRSKNNLGFSDYSTNFVITTHESPFSLEEFPIIQRAYYTIDGQRIRFQLSQARSSLLTNEHLCLQHYHPPSSIIETKTEIPSCIPLKSLRANNDELELALDQGNIRLKLCLINQTDVCSKSVSIPTGVALSNDSSELVLILIGKTKELFCSLRFLCFCLGAILGLCVVAGVIGLFICIQQRRRKSRSKNGSTDTLKANSNSNAIENFHATPVRVVDTNACLYYPAQTATVNEGLNSSLKPM